MFEKLKEIKRQAFIRITLKNSKKQIKELNQKRKEKGQEKLTAEERSKIIEKNGRAAEVAATYSALVVVLGLSGTFGTTKLIGAGKEHFSKEVTVDAEKTDKPIHIKNFNERKELWLNENIKVNLEEANQNEKLEQEVDEVFKRIDNSNDRIKAGIDYIKQLYVDEYNEKYAENKTIDDVEIRKSYNDALANEPRFLLYKDHADNGDEIIRRVMSYEEAGDNMTILDSGTYLSTNDWVVTVSVNETDGKKKQLSEDRFTLTEEGYTPVYDMGEQVEDAENLITENDMAGVINYFYDYYNEHANDNGKAEELKQGAKEKLIEYEKSKENKIRNRILGKDKYDKVNETDDELGL